MAPDDCVEKSDLITKLADAQAYYRAKFVGAHHITSGGREVSIVFEDGATHLFSEVAEDINSIPESELVTRNIGGGKRECRRFCLERAKLIDNVLPAISQPGRCVIDKGPPLRANVKVFGQKMSCGRHMCVVLRPGGGNSYVCLTAYPVDSEAYRQSSWQRPAKFPR